MVIQGATERWRLDRRNAYLIHCSLVDSKDRVSIFEAMPLPFDDEIKDSEEWSADDINKIQQEHANALKYWGENDPFKK